MYRLSMTGLFLVTWVLFSGCGGEAVDRQYTRGSGGADTMMQAGVPMPCAVADALKTNCQGCHGAQPIGGAPMTLLRYEDFHVDYTIRSTEGRIGQTVKLFALAHERINGSVPSKPMPPNPIDALQKQTLSDWLLAGASAGSEADRVCMMTGGAGTGGAAGTGGSAAIGGQIAGSGGETAGTGAVGGSAGSTGETVYSMEPLVPRAELGEKCYEFTTHGGQSLSDTSKYPVPVGERYIQFWFDVPWGADEVGSRFGARFDNVQVLHHWLLFSASSAKQAGTSQELEGDFAVMQNQEEGQQLLGGWAIGGSSLTMPDDVGLQLPAPGAKINAQWHTYNTTGQVQLDGSAVQVCTVPKSGRPHVAAMTWLGTEDIPGPAALGQGMGAGMQSFSGTCQNNSGGDITIVALWPHMHRLGVNMASSVNGVEVFNKPFYPDRQIYYDQRPPLVLRPGDRITSTCTYDNTTGKLVGYGESTDDEMCYQFAFAYPAGALNNGASSFVGASNICWGD